MSIKGGLKPPFSISFGAGRINATTEVKYLGVVLDPKRSYWGHVVSIKDKSNGLYKRLRAMTSENWGMNRDTARIIYRSVFLPRVTYAAEVWVGVCKLKKAINYWAAFKGTRC